MTRPYEAAKCLKGFTKTDEDCKNADNCNPKNSSCNVLSEIAKLSFYSNQCRCKYPTSNIQRNMQSCAQKFLGIPDGPLDFWAYGRQSRNSLASSRVLSWHPSQLDITLPTTLAFPKVDIRPYCPN